MDNSILTFKPLNQPLETKLTVLRTIRFLNLSLTIHEFQKITQKAFSLYSSINNGDTTAIRKVNQRIRGGCPKKVKCYPAEFADDLIKVVKREHKLFYPDLYKPKRKRIMR